MSHPVFTEHEFKAGLTRLGETDTRKLLRGGALDGLEARWAAEWLACGMPANEMRQEPQPMGLALAS